MRRIGLVCIAAALAGCAGAQHAMQHYDGIQPVTVQRPDDGYWVFDKPSDNRMMVTSSPGAAAAQGFGSGLLLGAVDNTPPLPNFQAAAEQHLINTGRASCRITQGYLVIKPQFEFRYSCDPGQQALPPRLVAVPPPAASAPAR